MKRFFLTFTSLLLLPHLLTSAPALAGSGPEKTNKTAEAVRVAVIGGMTMTGMWARVSEIFEAKTGIRVKVAATGPRSKIEKPFKKNKESDN